MAHEQEHAVNKTNHVRINRRYRSDLAFADKTMPKVIIKTWASLDEEAKEILIFFAHMIQPVSIDVFCAFSGLPVIKMLNIVERLKSKKLVCEKKGYGKGLYFADGIDLEGLAKYFAPRELHRKVLYRMVGFCSNLEDGSENHILLLAGLYFNLGDKEEGLQYIREAADILYRTGHIEKAFSYLDYLILACDGNISSSEKAGIYIDSVIRRINIDSYYRPSREYILSLEKAQAIAEGYKMWDRVARIKLALSQLLQMLGQYKKASKYMKDFELFADGINDPQMMRSTTLTICEYLRWKGMIAEAVQRYEKTTGNLEDFGNDEETLKATALIGFCNILSGRVSRGMGMINAVRDKGNVLNFHGAVIAANIYGALAFVDLQKPDEAELCLKKIGNIPPYLSSDIALSAINEIRCTILAQKGSYEEALALQHETAVMRQKSGWFQDGATCNFQRLYTLETKGYVSPEWNLDSEISKYINLDNAYMRGVAFRYKALRDIERKRSSREILADLKMSEYYLKKSGGMLELARTWIMFGGRHLENGDTKAGLTYLEDAWKVLSKIDKNLFPKEMITYMPEERRMEAVSDRLVEASESLETLQHYSSFLEKVLSAAMDFTGAMQGTFTTISPGNELLVLASRNVDPFFFDTPTADFMKTIILEAAKRRSEIILPQADDNNDDLEKILYATDITALICMPAKLRQHVHGFLCLVNRLDGTPFPDTHLPYVRLFCNQIALGLSNIEMYREVREQKDRFEEEAGFYKREMGVDVSPGRIIGRSEGMQKVLEQIRQVAPTATSVLIEGETGVGKELVAKAIHNLSDRKDGPFIPVNLSSLPQELVISELFGHEKGAFTGAHNRQKGRFELADSGTIFLDEIGDLPLALQVKLLRVLQEGVFERLGSAKPIKSDFRVIAATNKNLALEVERGTFRQDLYYRLNVFPIHVPALRDRKEDIVLLTKSFIDKTSRKLGKKIQPIPDKEVKKLLNYHWPGNVRELEHFVERVVILSDGYKLNLPDFGGTIPGGSIIEESPIVPFSEMERAYITKALTMTGWKVRGKGGAAILLGLKPTTLFFRMKKLGIEKPLRKGNEQD